MFCPYIKELRLEYENVLEIRGNYAKKRITFFKW